VHAFPSARVATHALRAPIDRKAAKTPNLNAVSAHQGIAHRIEHGLDGRIGVAVGQLAHTFRQQLNKIGSGHGNNK
jgi:hypothetical protein